MLQSLAGTGGACALTQSVIDRLEAAARAYDADQDDFKFRRVLVNMKDDIGRLTKIAEDMRVRAKAAADDNERLFDRALILISDLLANEDKLKALIADVKTAAAGDAAAIAVDQQKLADLKADRERLQKEVDETKLRTGVAGALCVIPFVNLFAAAFLISEAVDGKLGRLARAGQEFDLLATEMDKTQGRIGDMMGKISKIEAQMAESLIHERQLAVAKNGLEMHNKIYGRRISNALMLKGFYEDLGTAADSIGTHLTNVDSFARRLSETITVVSEQGTPRNATVKEALLQLGADADAYQPVDGNNVSFVELAIVWDAGSRDTVDAQGYIHISPPLIKTEIVGTLRRTKKTEWTLFADVPAYFVGYQDFTRKTFIFTEESRRAEQVVLENQMYEVKVSLDLWRVVKGRDKRLGALGWGAGGFIFFVRNETAQVNAGVVSVVDYADLQGTAKLGMFVEVGDGKWDRMEGIVKAAVLDEKTRDTWSVFLHDSAGCESVRLDLWTRCVYTQADGGAPEQQRYKVLGVS